MRRVVKLREMRAVECERQCKNMQVVYKMSDWTGRQCKEVNTFSQLHFDDKLLTC